MYAVNIQSTIYKSSSHRATPAFVGGFWAYSQSFFVKNICLLRLELTLMTTVQLNQNSKLWVIKPKQ